jgi:hypothetical protein
LDAVNNTFQRLSFADPLPFLDRGARLDGEFLKTASTIIH